MLPVSRFPVARLALEVHHRGDVHDIVLHRVDDPIRKSVNKAAPKTAFQPTPEVGPAGNCVEGRLDVCEELQPQPSI